MIPKRLIFIWIGEEIPYYGKFCIENFKQINPDFEVMLVHEKDFENSQNQDIIELREILQKDEKNIYTCMNSRSYMQKFKKTEPGKNCIFTDCLRLYLLNKYGGIYLDLDTFPVKAFDKKILSYENGFTVERERGKDDYFFMGFPTRLMENYIDKNINQIEYRLFSDNVQRISYFNSYHAGFFKKSFEKQKKKFIKCKCRFGESIYPKDFLTDYYIDHFKITTWRK